MNYREYVNTIDASIISAIKKFTLPFSRIALFIVFFWFGLLKVIAFSPANPLVSALLEKTLPFITFNQFIVIFGLFEMMIGIAFLVPRLERLAMALLLLHMVAVCAPLILLPAITWQSPFIPTMEGQYIIKNIVLIALALGVAARIRPLHLKHS